MTKVYYNENNPYCVEWLKNLIAANLIPKGDVDARSILDVTPNDLKSYRQCHFFAGIGGWAYALALADFPADREVWTGSCPCQPFSAAGKGGGFADERHLWPYWHHLIRVQKPATIFGEQVASKAGQVWLDLVHADLASEDYAFGVSDLAAAGVSAPHLRQRFFSVADADGRQPSDGHLQRGGQQRQQPENGFAMCMGNAERSRLQERERNRGIQREALGAQSRETAERGSNPWHPAEWLPCTDGKARPVEPGTFPLAHGVPGRVGRLRAYGNAIVPQVAAEFVKAYLAT